VSRAFGKLRSLNLIDGNLARVRLCNPQQLSSLATAGHAAQSHGDHLHAPAIDNYHAAMTMPYDD
jgi:hypothetical protein